MRNLAFACLMLLSGCNQASSESTTTPVSMEPSAEEIARQQELQRQMQAQQQQDCVKQATNTAIINAQDTETSFLQRLQTASFDECPNDFIEAFVTYRTSAKRFVDKRTEFASYATDENEKQALGQGTAVTLLEWATSTSTGETPYTDYVQGKKRLASELEAYLEDLRRSSQALEVAAARYGVTITNSQNATTDSGATTNEVYENAM